MEKHIAGSSHAPFLHASRDPEGGPPAGLLWKNPR